MIKKALFASAIALSGLVGAAGTAHAQSEVTTPTSPTSQSDTAGFHATEDTYMYTYPTNMSPVYRVEKGEWLSCSTDVSGGTYRYCEITPFWWDDREGYMHISTIAPN